MSVCSCVLVFVRSCGFGVCVFVCVREFAACVFVC